MKYFTDTTTFWYPMTFVYPSYSATKNVPWLTYFPTNNINDESDSFVLIKPIGNSPAGLYVEGSNGQFRHACPYDQLIPMVTGNYGISVYLGGGIDTVPTGSKVFRNGYLSTETSIPENDTNIWVVGSPSSSGGGSGDGTVTSVSMTVPAGFAVSGGPVTSSGTLAVDFDVVPQGAALIGPADASGVPSWRTLSYDELEDKPTIPAAQVQSDWNASSGVAQILNKPTIPAAQVSSDWNATTGVAQILNKPTIPAAQVQSDWNATTGLGVVLNKPTIPSAYTLPPATDTALGGVIAGAGLSVAANGTLSVTAVPADQVNADWDATTGVAEILNKPLIGTAAAANVTDFATAAQGALADTALQPGDLPAPYELPTASDTVKGGVRIGGGLTITGDVLSLDADAGLGTVTSVGLTLPAQFTVANSPVTGSGTIAATWTVQAAGSVLAGPTTGASMTPNFRQLVEADIPPLDAAKIVTGVFDPERLGTGTMTASTFLAGDGTFKTISVPAAQVNSDWNATTGVTQILNKPTLGTAASADSSDFATAAQGALADTALQPGDVTAPVNADWNASTGLAQILNKPTIPAAQVQSDWNATTGLGVILNKPTIPSAYQLPEATTAALGGVIVGENIDVAADGTISVTFPENPGQVQANWAETTTTASSFIQNKPTIPAAQVSADWNATTGVAQILNKPTLGTASASATTDFATSAQGALADTALQPGDVTEPVNADWNAASGLAQILNKPTIPAAQVQSDWNATTGLGVVLNKPTIPAAQVNSDWDATSGVAQILNKPTIPEPSVTELRVANNFLEQRESPTDSWDIVAPIEAFVARDLSTTNRLILSNYGLIVRPPLPQNGTDGDVLTYKSGDLTTWTSYPSGLAQTIQSFATNDEIFVAVGLLGGAAWSDNGTDWNVSIPETTGEPNLFNVIWDGKQFISVGNNGRVMSSPDGKTWDIRTVGSAVQLRGITYKDGVHLAGGTTSLYRSVDGGVTWASVARPSTDMTTALDFLHTGLGMFFFFTINEGYTSFDGITWTLRYTSTIGTIKDSFFFNGVMVVAGSDNVLAVSSDGLEFTQIPKFLPEGMIIYQVTATNKRFVLGTTDAATPTLWESSDGYNWVGIEGTTIQYAKLSSMMNTVVMAGLGGTIQVSYDGVAPTWVTPTTPVSGVTSINTRTGDVTLTLADLGGVASSVVGQPNGLATLGSDGKVPAAQLPEESVTVVNGQVGVVDLNAEDVQALPITGGTLAGSLGIWAAYSYHYEAVSNGVIDTTKANYFFVAMSSTDPTTITFINTERSTGDVIYFRAHVVNPGTQNLVWPLGIKWAGGIVPSHSPNTENLYSFYKFNEDDSWYGRQEASDFNNPI